MLENLFAELGPWNWLVLGFILLGLEIVVPGVFLLWIGIAALITGAASLILWNAAIWIWQVQIVVFLALALVCAYVGKQIVRRSDDVSDQPLLNQRGAQLIGRTATLTEPISNGRGRIRLGDTLWRVSGPDMPAGAQVRVTGAADADLELTVEQIR